MSKYNKYYKEVDTLAKEHFKAIEKAEQKVKGTEEAYNSFKRTNGTGEGFPMIKAKLLSLEADYNIAKEELKNTMQEFAESVQKVDAIGEELAEEISQDYGVKPEDVDSNTLELLKSGIVTAEEYIRLFQQANNPTMKRLIAHYAEQDSEKALTEDKRTAMRNMSSIIETGKEYTDNFSIMRDSFIRTAGNTAMIPYWDELTAEIVNDA